MAEAPKTGGIHAPVKPSPELGAIVVNDALPRSQVISKVWDHIKKNNLQNPANKREILADDDAVLKRLMAREDWRFYKPLPVDLQIRHKPQILLSRPDAESVRYLDKVVRQWLASGAQQKARELRAGEVNFEVASLRDGLVCHG